MGWLDFLPEVSLPDTVDLNIFHYGDDIDADDVRSDYVEGDQLNTEVAIDYEGEIIRIEEIKRVVPGEIAGDSPISITNDREELVLDPETLQQNNEWEGLVKPALKDGWKVEGAVSTKQAHTILQNAERTIDDDLIREIKEFFRDKIFTTDFQLLKSALTIDKALNAPSGEGLSEYELNRRKRQLADKYHRAAFSLPSMCSAGYFDEGEIFRHIYKQMSDDNEFNTNNYDRMFRIMIISKPFVTFVKSSDSTEEVEFVVFGKISKLPDYDIPIPYIDVGGVGTQNHEKIRDAIKHVEKRFENIEYDEKVKSDQLIVRIDADSIS